MKRWKGIFLAFLLVLTQIPAAQAVGTSASSAILMEAGSGRVLYEHNADEPRLIASITKLMTALVALESGKSLDDVVTIQAEDTRTEGSALYLKPGEHVKLETLLYGLLLHSGNDAALAIARFCGGSMEDFVAGMNARARELGMTNSHFANPNGLNDEGHYSSARDMALLARACLDNEYLAQMVSTRTITLEGRTFTNHHKLLWRYEGCVGMKTGFTEKAGRTLVSAARRDGMTLIAVTLNDPDDWADHAALFDQIQRFLSGQLFQRLYRRIFHLFILPVILHHNAHHVVARDHTPGLNGLHGARDATEDGHRHISIRLGQLLPRQNTVSLLHDGLRRSADMLRQRIYQISLGKNRFYGLVFGKVFTVVRMNAAHECQLRLRHILPSFLSFFCIRRFGRTTTSNCCSQGRPLHNRYRLSL